MRCVPWPRLAEKYTRWKSIFRTPRGLFVSKEWCGWSRILYPIRSVGSNSCLRVISHPQMSDLVLWEQKYAKMTPFLPRNSGNILGYNLSVFQAKFSFLGSSLNAAVVFNANRAAWATSKLKTTTAFNEEPKNENYIEKKWTKTVKI